MAGIGRLERCILCPKINIAALVNAEAGHYFTRRLRPVLSRWGQRPPRCLLLSSGARTYRGTPKI